MPTARKTIQSRGVWQSPLNKYIARLKPEASRSPNLTWLVSAGQAGLNCCEACSGDLLMGMPFPIEAEYPSPKKANL